MSASTSPRKAPEGASLPPTPIRTANILSNEARQLLAVDIHRTVGHYKLGKTIGQGSYGKVKLAVDIRTGQKVRDAADGELICARRYCIAFFQLVQITRMMDAA